MFRLANSLMASENSGRARPSTRQSTRSVPAQGGKGLIPGKRERHLRRKLLKHCKISFPRASRPQASQKKWGPHKPLFYLSFPDSQFYPLKGGGVPETPSHKELKARAD